MKMRVDNPKADPHPQARCMTYGADGKAHLLYILTLTVPLNAKVLMLVYCVIDMLFHHDHIYKLKHHSLCSLTDASVKILDT